MDGGISWKQFVPGTFDYLHINANNTRMRTHLRTEKITFWNNLLPSLLTNTRREPAPSVSYKTEVIILTCILVIFFILLLTCGGLLCVYRRKQRHYITTKRAEALVPCETSNEKSNGGHISIKL